MGVANQTSISDFLLLGFSQHPEQQPLLFGLFLAVYLVTVLGNLLIILAINYDISRLLMVESAVQELISVQESTQSEPEKIVNVNDLLEELIQKSVALVGKPVALMNKDDKVKAIQFLNQNGAFLVTKSGDKIAKYFGISKYTLYSYIDAKQS